MVKEKDVEHVKSHHPQDYSVEECECNQSIELERLEMRLQESEHIKEDLSHLSSDERCSIGSLRCT